MDMERGEAGGEGERGFKYTVMGEELTVGGGTPRNTQHADDKELYTCNMCSSPDQSS